MDFFRPPSSIYHNKVSSALYVAESSGKESEVQGVQILMKDDEKVPMTSAQQFSPSYSIDDVIREPESAVATSADFHVIMFVVLENIVMSEECL